MLDWLNNLDVAVFSAINGSLTSLDTVMWWASQPLAWTPLYVAVVWSLFKKHSNKVLILICIAVTVGLTDLLSARIIKPTAQRLRPSHQVELASDIHLHQYEDGSFYKGGKYGFVSSHAANHMGIAILCGALLGGGAWMFWLVVWAVLIGYSRIHLGVHFPGDVLFGWLVGAVAGGFVYTKAKLRL